MSSLIKNIQRTAPPRHTEVSSVPTTFIGFCGWLGVELTAGQAEFARVAFDGAEPVDGDLAARLFGQSLPVGRCRVVAAVCGRRAGKSYVLVALRLLHGMLVRDVPQLPPGQRAVALIIAPRDRLRMEVFRYAVGAVRSKPELERMLVGDPKVDSFMLRRPDGKTVSFETGVATAGGTAARGRWFTDFALDESAFFRDDSFKVNDEELFRAGSATLFPGGQVLVTSTPWAEAGLLYRLWKERPEGCIVGHAPTLLLNDSEITREAVKQAEAQDPDNARREFGAEFMTSGTTVFFESTTIDNALAHPPEHFELQPLDEVSAGGDFGFRSDSSALLLVALRDGMLHVFDGEELRPGEEPLKPSKTVEAFANRIAGRCGYLMADQHYREAIAEHLNAHGLSYMPAPNSPADTYVRARMLLREGRVKIHGLEFRERLVQQMREVHGKPTSGGGMSIVHPRWAKGGHGDLVAALVLALWQLGGDAIPAPKPVEGTKEYAEAARVARAKHYAEQQQPASRSRRGGFEIDRGGGKHRQRRMG
jgi:hypothetical protein